MNSGYSPSRSVILSGPSVVGKTTFVTRLASDWGYTAPRPITTRSQRLPLHEYREYDFLSRSQVEQGIATRAIIGYPALGHLYGYPAQVVSLFMPKSKVCLHALTSIALDISSRAPAKPILVFLKHPSYEEFIRRLSGRYTPGTDAFNARVLHADEELSRVGSYDIVLSVSSYDAAFDELIRILSLP